MSKSIEDLTTRVPRGLAGHGFYHRKSRIFQEVWVSNFAWV